jgi:AraC-like DNA-binding protein
MEVEALVLRLVATLLRKVPSTLVDEASRALLDDEARSLGPRLARVAEYIRHHAAEPISIAAVAQAHGLSSGYLSRLFKSETGETFGSFIAHVRLRRSLDLLSAPKPRPITHVALDCGFPNVKSFNLAFRRAFGGTPSAWRQARLARPETPVPSYAVVDESGAMRLLHRFADESHGFSPSAPEIP